MDEMVFDESGVVYVVEVRGVWWCWRGWVCCWCCLVFEVLGVGGKMVRSDYGELVILKWD